MVLTVSDARGVNPTSLLLPPPQDPVGLKWPLAPPQPVQRQPEPSYHPQVQPPTPELAGCGPSSAGGQYGIPEGQTLSGVASGTGAQPFDVTMSQLATAVYANEARGGPPCGWEAVGNDDLAALGVEDPQGWREQYLAGGDELVDQEFAADVYTDGNGNYVLAYRGTAEGMDDWMNNFTQGTGFETPGGIDKFSGLAARTANAFEQVFGNREGVDGESTNLAMTGHSQGGGLASAGSLATGIPAVTFDASGLHPNTIDRLGLTPEQARATAEGGQIRAYSLHSDLLTQAQESGPLGLAAPDALGTSIVVEPGPLATHTLAGEAAGIEFGWGPLGQGIANGVVEGLRHTNLPILGTVGDLAYSALSHNPNVLTNAMIEQQPWQAGYENPADTGKWLQDLIPEAAKDDYARNTHDLITDIGTVFDTQFANGRFIQGGASILGDVAEGVINSIGDTVQAGTDELAQAIRQGIDGAADRLGVATDAAAGRVALAGDAVQHASDQLAVRLALAGDAAQVATDAFAGRVSLAGDTAQVAGDVLAGRVSAAGDALHDALDAVPFSNPLAGDAVRAASDLVAGGISFAGNATEAVSNVVAGGASLAGRVVDVAGDVLAGGTHLAGNVVEGAGNVLAGGISRIDDAFQAAGNAVAGGVSAAGDAIHAVGDAAGNVVEGAADVAGWIGQNVFGLRR